MGERDMGSGWEAATCSGRGSWGRCGLRRAGEGEEWVKGGISTRWIPGGRIS